MPNLRDSLRLTAEEVTAPCDLTWLSFATTEDLPALDAVFGQERAVRAIEFALGMSAPGYNLFASGPEGFGKTTIVESFLRRRAAQMPAPLDWVYVHNFQDPDRPVAISLPPGTGHAFAQAVERTVEAAGRELREAFESDSYARRRQELADELDRQRGVLLEALQGQAGQMGFALQFGQAGIVSAPLINGRPASEEVFAALPEEQRNEIMERRRQLERAVQEALLQVRALERASGERASKLDEEVAGYATSHLFEPLIEQYGSDAEIREFLEAASEDIQQQRDRFRQAGQPQPMVIPGMMMPSQAPQLSRYAVNVVVSNDPQRGAPVIREGHPTYYNLLGRIEYQGQFGTAVTDHTMVKPGSLARANGGYLVIRLRDLLNNPQALDGLKRALASQRLAVENIAEAFGLVPTSGLRPEPLPLNVKVVVIGEGSLYGLLYRYDPDFRDLFRVKADFETEFERTVQNVRGLAHVIRAECERSTLLPFSRIAVAHLIEHSSRMVEDQRRLSANMAAFLDIVRQADYWARQDSARIVDGRHVDRALDERIYRSSLVRERIIEAMNDGSLYVATEGSVVGQINALSVYDLGDISFGRPSRVTCVVSAGRGSMVMVERESEMAGRIHNKGFLILRGFLAHRFGQNRANALHASMTFEQLYGDIDGDSASSTELYALLSALAERPIDQQIAVTGSVDQLGRVQPIGGASAKIEGFFDICSARGLTGQHGVMVPRTNVENIVLRADVAQAIRDGQFHIYAVDTIDEGIEVLTGVPAGGERDAEGRYPEGTIFRLVEDRLAAFAAESDRRPNVGGAELQHVPPARTEYPTPPGIPPSPPPEPPVIV
ncbi:MAG: Lon protease family protein [Dehalococcoidia bacterium]